MDEWKRAWAELDHRVETLSTELNVTRAQAASRRLVAKPVFNLVLYLLTALLIGSTYAGRLDQPLFIVCAAVLHAVTIGIAASNIWQLALLGEIDWAAPVVRNARRLEQLRKHRLFVDRWVLTFAPLLWVPMSVFFAVLLVGVEPHAGWLVANAVFGVAAAVGLVALARRAEVSRWRWFQRLKDEIAGRNLNDAIAFLSEVERFEHAG